MAKPGRLLAFLAERWLWFYAAPWVLVGLIFVASWIFNSGISMVVYIPLLSDGVFIVLIGLWVVSLVLFVIKRRSVIRAALLILITAPAYMVALALLGPAMTHRAHLASALFEGRIYHVARSPSFCGPPYAEFVVYECDRSGYLCRVVYRHTTDVRASSTGFDYYTFSGCNASFTVDAPGLRLHIGDQVVYTKLPGVR
jgi:hypothetical protein